MSHRLPVSERRQAARAFEEEQFQNWIDNGGNLIERALNDPESLHVGERRIVLGDFPYSGDSNDFTAKVTDGRWNSKLQLESTAGGEPWKLTIPACKLFICDCRKPLDGEDLDSMYEAQLRAEADQTVEERARENVRYIWQKRGRRNARIMLEALQRELESAGRLPSNSMDEKFLWDQVKPLPPYWLFEIRDGNYYGFALYRTKEIADKFGPATERVWKLFTEMFRGDRRGEGFRGYKCGNSRIFEGHTLNRKVREYWAKFEEASETDWAAMRRHFQAWREAESEGSIVADILLNTFIVFSSDCIPAELGNKLYNAHELPPLYVWAVDPDWEPPSPDAEADEDGYAGRVKVSIKAVYGWFYGARWEDQYTLKQLWEKAQKNQDNLWTCESLRVKEWDHEPYVLVDGEEVIQWKPPHGMHCLCLSCALNEL